MALDSQKVHVTDVRVQSHYDMHRSEGDQEECSSLSQLAIHPLVAESGTQVRGEVVFDHFTRNSHGKEENKVAIK